MPPPKQDVFATASSVVSTSIVRSSSSSTKGVAHAEAWQRHDGGERVARAPPRGHVMAFAAH